MLFAWANKQLEKLAETVAPVSSANSPHHKFLSALANGNEDLALSILHGNLPSPSSPDEIVVPLDPHTSILNASKGSKAIHIACQYSASRVIHALVSEFGVSIDSFDMQGNTGLHYAAMSRSPHALSVVKTLVQSYNASVTIKNQSNQTAYDVSTDTLIRQYLLPLQLQRETQECLDSGGPLPAGTDMSSHRLHASKQFAANNAPPSSIAPPPQQGAPPMPMGGPLQRRMIPNDGFHSSASDVSLQQKYGHVVQTPSVAIPPPTLPNTQNVRSAPPMRSKYLAYDPVTGATSSYAPPPVSHGFFPPPTMSSQPAPSYNNFANPPAAPISTSQQPPAAPKTFLPPPPQILSNTSLAASAPTALPNTLPPPPQLNQFTPPPLPMMNNAPPSYINKPPVMTNFSPPSNAADLFSAPPTNDTNAPPPQMNMSSPPPPMNAPPQMNMSSPPPPMNAPPQMNSASVNAKDIFSAPPSG